jgi:hypothetical protein
MTAVAAAAVLTIAAAVTVAVASISVAGATAVTGATVAVAGLRCGAEMLEVRRYAYMSFIRDFTYFTSGGID